MDGNKRDEVRTISAFEHEKIKRIVYKLQEQLFKNL